MSALGFADPVFDSQTAFRAVLKALASPGETVACGERLAPPAPLARAAAAALLALADFETPLWIDPDFPGGEAIADYLKFHTGAAMAAAPQKAAFALMQSGGDALDLTRFAQGSLEYPDRSTTLILQVERLSRAGVPSVQDRGGPFGGRGLVLSGPGVKGKAEFDFAPRPPNFLAALGENHARFPLGVDLILAADAELAALPRSTDVRGGG